MMETSPGLYNQPFLSYVQILCKCGSQTLQKYCHLNVEDLFEFCRPWKLPYPPFPPNRTNSINWPKKFFYYKGHFGKFCDSNIFAKRFYPYVKFYEKHDGDVAETVLHTIPELCPNFVQNGAQSHR